MILRQATASDEDIRILVYYRIMMFISMGFTDSEQLYQCEINSKVYFKKTIPTQEFFGWIAEIDGNHVGCGGLVIDKHPPGPVNKTGKLGYIMNVVTEPEFRGKGVGTKIMQTIISFCKDQGINVVTLHYTEMGRNIYKKLGFTDSNEMKLVL